MQWLAALCIRRPVLARVIVALLTVIGAFSYASLGIDRFPRIDFPIVVVTTLVPGASPDQVETDVSDKLEAAVNTISGIEELRSVSVEGISQVYVTFQIDKDVNIAAQEVSEKVNALPMSDFPARTERPSILKLDPDASPILTLVVSGPGNVREVTETADKKIKKALESLDGVGQVTLLGGRARQINVVVDPDRLRKYAIPAGQVEMSLRAQNIELPSGRVEQGATALTLRTLGRVPNVEALGDITLGSRDGYPVKLSDVAEVVDGMAEPTSVGFIGTSPAVLLNIRKQSGTNTVQVVKNLKDRIEELKTQLPEGFTLRIARDQSEFIGNAISAVKEHLILGALFAAIIVFLFLGSFRSTIIAAVSIPVSIISTFGVMRIAGFTLNSLTMLALTLAVGIVIDDAIVVLENIYRHIEEKGKTPVQAAIDGTKEIGLAVLATTASLVVVFLPVAFMGGIVGRFMNSFGLTMAFSIVVSLIVAFVLTPMMSSRLLKAPKHAPTIENAPQTTFRQKPPGGLVERAVQRFYGPIERGYMVLLRWSLRHRWVIVLTMFVTLFATVPLAGIANKNFLPDEDESQFAVTMRAPEGTSLDATRILATRMATEMEKLPGVAYSVTTIGDDAQQTSNLANIYVKLVPPTERKKSQLQLIVDAREAVKKFDAEHLRTSVGIVPAFAGGGNASAVQLQLQGPDLKKLEAYTERIMVALRNAPGAVDPDTSLVVGKPEIRAIVDRRKADELGVSIVDIQNALGLLVGGYKVGTYAEQGEQYNIFVRATPSARQDEESLKRLAVPSTKLGTATLDNFATFEKGSGPSRIDRYNRRKSVMIFANLEPGRSQQALLDYVYKAAADLKMEPGYALAPLGQSKELGKAAANFFVAFILSMIFMYLVLAAQFESWLHPITILISLPLTIPFAILSVIIFQQSLNIFSMLGVLVLFGVVKKNSILQVDHTINLRREGLPREEAILQANRDRLRPILMTTVAFVAGMIPLVFSSGAGAGTNRATGFVIIGGQSMVLLLTLLATPVVYSLFDDLSIRFNRVWERVFGPSDPIDVHDAPPSAAE